MALPPRLRQTVEAIRCFGAKLRDDPGLAPTVLRLLSGTAFDRPPIVIGGCGRSGTTLLLSLLSAHPSIVAIPFESQAFTATLYDEEPDLQAPFQVWRIYCALADLPLEPSVRRWCEKTPKNVVVFERILDRFDGDVRLLHVVRDGRDVVTSRHTSKPDAYWVEPKRWIEDVSAGLALRDHEKVHTLRYEDLVMETEETLERLGAFLGEELSGFAESWVERARIRSFESPERRPARPLDRSGIGRWQKPEHRERAEALMRHPRARDLLAELGYLS